MWPHTPRCEQQAAGNDGDGDPTPTDPRPATASLGRPTFVRIDGAHASILTDCREFLGCFRFLV